MNLLDELYVMASKLDVAYLLFGKVTGIVAYPIDPAPCRDWCKAQSTWEEDVAELAKWRIVGVAVA